MTTLIPSNAKIPAHLAKFMGAPSALNAAVGANIGGTGPSYPRISIKASRFRIVEDGTETVVPDTSLNVVIVGANPHLSKTWYAKTWNPDDEPSAPDCFSLDGIEPHPESTKPQSDRCATCKMNQWGSKITPTGQKVKACADKKRLAVVAANDPTGPIYLLEVTPAALKGLSQYQRELSMRGIMLEIVTTAVSFDTDASFPKLKFSFGGFNSEETQEAVTPLFGSDQVLEITGEAQPKPEPVATKAKPVLVKAPEPEEDEAEAIRAAVQRQLVRMNDPKPEPVVEQPKATRGFGAAKPQAAPQPVADTPKPTRKAVAKEPAAAPTASLADEIASLIQDMGDDD